MRANDPDRPITLASRAAVRQGPAADSNTLHHPPGIAAGYRDAMHGLCIRCHIEHEQRQAVEEPYLGRCTACHRDHTSLA